jgi:ABC-type nitrate/sulfonate/bicarbonate transport system substrate-binding protein
MFTIHKATKTVLLLMLVAVLLTMIGCGNSEGKTSVTEKEENNKKLQDITVVLDWTPNTNHTGLYVARDMGYYKEEGLNVTIVQPGEAGADTMVAAGNAQFGVSYQEGVTLARIADVPIVSIAAVIQHNTSGFAAPVDRNMKTPKDFEGKKYGGGGWPVDAAMIESLMISDKADFSKVEFVNTGGADYFASVKRDIDFAWIFYAWTGIEAELRGEKIDIVYPKDYGKELDYYTPVLVTSESMIADQPETVKAFMKATSRGYEFAIDEPEKAADVLIKAEPDLNKELVIASQKWLSDQYRAEAPRWGEQKLEVWENYTAWMLKYKLLEKSLDAPKAFTNEFLPE